MNWQKLREQVLERDNYTCQICLNQLTELNIHHLIPRRRQGLDSINNLTSVCDTCHGLIETKPQKYKMPRNITVIQISSELRDQLKELGSKGETYQDIIIRLMDYMEFKDKKK